MIHKLLLFLILGLVSSCTKSYYIPPENESVATVSFSNLSDELADIYIIINDNTYPINRDVIERKKPQNIARYKTNILAGNAVTFKYEYNWLMNERTEITTTYSKINTPARVNNKKINVANTCNSTVTFKPEKNKHYEVYFGLLVDKCIIKASEVTIDADSMKQLISVTPL